MWEKNACVRVTGRACISPTVRPDIRYDHTAMAAKQPNSRDMTTEAGMDRMMTLCCRSCSTVMMPSATPSHSRLADSICMGRITTHTATYKNSSGQ